MAHASSDVITHIQDVGFGFFRQLLCFNTSTPYEEAVAALRPTTKFMGAAAKPSDDEATIRAQVDALAAADASVDCVAILGPNEPNDSDAPWDPTSITNTLKRCFWIWDEAHTVSWPHRGGGGAGVNRPPIWGPALKRNGSGAWDPDGHRYDDDLAALAAATYNPGAGALHLSDVIDGIDHHQYDGGNSPGDRVNGHDSYGSTPASLTVSTVDSKCSRVDFEIALAKQMAPTKPVKARSEFGWEEVTGTQQHADWAQETFLRCYKRGVMAATYEIANEGPGDPHGSGNWFGLYEPSDGTKKPVYAAVKTLCGYSGSADISTVAWFEPLSSHNPDQQYVALPKAGGGWDLYILWEARTSTDLVIAPGHHVVGKSRTSKDDFANKHYTINQSSDTMTVVSVI